MSSFFNFSKPDSSSADNNKERDNTKAKRRRKNKCLAYILLFE
ncbi:hypothetical protein LINGRAHAP2_LOCUS21196 [Linum grandiflorum]